MKLLIIGLDGGDREIIERFDMPFLQNILKNSTIGNAREDLFSRGWAEIFTGKHGRETAAFYLRPECDGSRAFNKSFKIQEALQSPDVKTIWDMIGSKGLSVGWMNMPTASPAPNVNGFFVAGSAGGGGGGSVDDSLTDETANSQEVIDVLRKHEYIKDVRVLPSSDFGSIEKFFELLFQMVKRRTNAYLELSNKFKPGFGFLGYRSLNIVQNIAHSEIRSIHGMDDGQFSKDNRWEKGLGELYSLVDASIKRVFDTLTPDNYMIVSDHGSAPFRYRMDANHVLQRAGLQDLTINKRQSAKNLLKKALPFLPKFRGQHIPRLIEKKVDFGSSRAFSPAWFIPGIYINDRTRFGGSVSPDSDMSALSRIICEAFNGDTEVQKTAIRAIPYREKYFDSTYQQYLPDVWIETPDDVYPSSADSFLSKNEWYGDVPSPSGLPASVYTGLKGSHPLLVCSPEMGRLIGPEDKMDLTMVYKLTERLLSRGD